MSLSGQRKNGYQGLSGHGLSNEGAQISKLRHT